MSEENQAVLPHLSVEFFVWLWFATIRDGGMMNLGDDIGTIEVWVDRRLAFQALDEGRARAVLTGDNAASCLEARAALAGGKVPQEVQLHIRREEREYGVTLRSPYLDLAGVKLPEHATDGQSELLFERMYLLEDLWFVIGALYKRFAIERTSSDWRSGTLAAIQSWVSGNPIPDADDRASA